MLFKENESSDIPLTVDIGSTFSKNAYQLENFKLTIRAYKWSQLFDCQRAVQFAVYTDWRPTLSFLLTAVAVAR